MRDNKTIVAEAKIRNCPFAKFEFWDALVSSEGDYICNCLEKPEDPGEYGGPGTRPVCCSRNYTSCEWYIKAIDK